MTVVHTGPSWSHGSVDGRRPDDWSLGPGPAAVVAPGMCARKWRGDRARGGAVLRERWATEVLGLPGERTGGRPVSGSAGDLRGAITVRPLEPADVDAAVALHLDSLGDEFISGFGAEFLRRYYRAFSASPHGLVLVAIDGSGGQLAGFLLGNLDPAAHYRAVVRDAGVALGMAMLVHACRHPRVGWALARTRARRYAGGLARMAWRRLGAALRPASPGVRPTGEATGEVTHVAVGTGFRRRGIGALLVDRAIETAASAGLARLELVTPADDLGAQAFYDRTGWQRDGTLVSRSGERFVAYHRDLRGAIPGAEGGGAVPGTEGGGAAGGAGTGGPTH